MADEDMDEGMLEYLDWLYVEDDFPLTDELAETQIPSPGYAGTQFEIDLMHEEPDFIGYWDDLEYVEDEYWDHGRAAAVARQSPSKRKREQKDVDSESHEVKRRRTAMQHVENVKYISLSKRLEAWRSLPPALREGKPFALLPDWRVRYVNDTGVEEVVTMPKEMKMAAEARDEDTPPQKRMYDAMVQDGYEEEGWEDDDEDEDGEGDDMASQLANLDPEALKAVLKQKLGDAGLSGMDEGAFMQSITKMLSGEDDDDDATGDLATALLGQATKGNDTAISGWLSQQGVSLDDEEEEHDASSVATTELPDGPMKEVKSSVQVSPPDSAIGILKLNGDAKQTAAQGSSPLTSAKKRPAPVEEEDADGVKKRKRVVFDVPSSQPEEPVVEETAGAEASTTEAPLTAEPQAEPATSEDPLMSETTIKSTAPAPASKSASAGPKSTNSKSAPNTNNKTTAKNTKSTPAYAKPTAGSSAKQTRKRKAEDEEEGNEKAGAKPKKQQKRATKTEKAMKEEPVTPEVDPKRRTRSAKARGGK